MSYGVQPTGFVAETVQNLVSDLTSAFVSNLDPALDTSPEEPVGQIIGIFAEKLAELWELGGVAYNGMSRDNAEGPQLDNVNGLTGTKRLGASPSFTLQTCAFTAVGTYGVGGLVANVSGQPSIQFANSDLLVIALTGGNYVASIGSTVVATNPTLPITVVGLKFICTVDGPTVANASTLNTITSPVSGWSSTNNPDDASLGTLLELDTPYRLRGELEIAAVGSGNPDAMRADVLAVNGVIQAFCLENTTNAVDGNGLDPHSFLVVIWDGASPAASDDEVAQAIWNDKPTGITYSSNAGVTDGVALDANGGSHIMGFSRAAQETLYLVVLVTMISPYTLTSAGALAIKQAIVAATQSQFITSPTTGTQAPNPAYLGLGNNVIASALEGAILNAGLDVLDVTSLKLGFSSSPSGTSNLTVSALQIAIADTANILINGM